MRGQNASRAVALVRGPLCGLCVLLLCAAQAPVADAADVAAEARETPGPGARAANALVCLGFIDSSANVN